MRNQSIDELNSQLDRYGAWLRVHGRRNTAKARSISASMQQIRNEISRRTA